MRLACAAALGILLVAPLQAQSNLSVGAQVDFGFRIYQDDGLFVGQSRAGPKFFIGAELNAFLPVGAGEVALQFAALGDDASGRSALNLKKAYYAQGFDAWDLLVGYNVETWGVAEGRSVLNLLNPANDTDLVFGGEPLGTPMINANFDTSLGTFSAYALVGFVQPNAAGRDARARAPWGTNTDRAVYQEGNGRNLDFALRYSNNFSLGDGSLDIAASYFNGTDRHPLSLPGCGYPDGAITETACTATNTAIVNAFEGGFPDPGDRDAIWDFVNANATGPLVRAVSGIPGAGLVPYYQKIQHLGVSAVYARGDLQLRFEAALRQARNETASFAGVIGGDYTFHNLGPGTLTVAVEYLYDGGDIRQPVSVFDNDMFLGLNYLLNDTRDTRLSLGGFYDLNSHAQLYQLSVSTRVNDNLRAEFNIVQARTDGWNDPLAFIARDNFIELKLSAYF